MNGAGGNNGGVIFEEPVYDVSDRSQKWAIVFEDRHGGFVGQLQSSNDESVKLRNAFAYDARLVKFGGVVMTPQGPGVVKAPTADMEINVWDPHGMRTVDVLSFHRPRLVVILADANLELRTLANQMISVVEQGRKARLSAETGLDLSGRVDPGLLAKAAASGKKG